MLWRNGVLHHGGEGRSLKSPLMNPGLDSVPRCGTGMRPQLLTGLLSVATLAAAGCPVRPGRSELWRDIGEPAVSGIVGVRRVPLPRQSASSGVGHAYDRQGEVV